MYSFNFKAYVGSVILIGAIIYIATFRFWYHITTADGVFAIAVLLSSVVAIEMIRGKGLVSVTLPVMVATSIALGPAAGCWISGGFSWT